MAPTASDTFGINLAVMDNHLRSSKRLTEELDELLTNVERHEWDIIERCDRSPAPAARTLKGIPEYWTNNDHQLFALVVKLLSRLAEMPTISEINADDFAGDGGELPRELSALNALGWGPFGDSTGKGKIDENLRIVGWDPVTGPLYSKGTGDGAAVDPNDIDQRSLGDCYLVSAMAGVANHNAKLITDAITPNDDGTYTVRLYEEDGGVMVPREITVTAEMPVMSVHNEATGASRESTSYTAGSGDGELWPQIVEKAYAQMIGDGDLVDGYEEIIGGNGAVALSALSGNPASTDTSDLTTDQLRGMLAAGAVLPATHSSAEGKTSTYEVGGQTYIRSHQYWVERVEPDGTIVVQNPHEYGGKERQMTIDEFNEAFREVDIVELESPAPPAAPHPVGPTGPVR